MILHEVRFKGEAVHYILTEVGVDVGVLVGVDVGVCSNETNAKEQVSELQLCITVVLEGVPSLREKLFGMLLTEVGVDVGVLVGVLVGVDVGFCGHVVTQAKEQVSELQLCISVVLEGLQA